MLHSRAEYGKQIQGYMAAYMEAATSAEKNQERNKKKTLFPIAFSPQKVLLFTALFSTVSGAEVHPKGETSSSMPFGQQFISLCPFSCHDPVSSP